MASASIHLKVPLATPQHIRLLKVTVDKAGASTYDLISAPLAKAPRFDALSYAWLQRQGELAVGESTVVACPENCVDFLDCYHPGRGTHFLWIDSICINQADEAEKSGQVQMMGDIYRRARRVIIWLGLWSLRDLAAGTARYSLVRRLHSSVHKKERVDNWVHERARLTYLGRSGELWFADIELPYALGKLCGHFSLRGWRLSLCLG